MITNIISTFFSAFYSLSCLFFKDSKKRDSVSILSADISFIESTKLCCTGISIAKPDIFITSVRKLCCKALEIFTNKSTSIVYRLKILYTLVRSQCIRLANSVTVSPLSSKTAFTKCPMCKEYCSSILLSFAMT